MCLQAGDGGVEGIHPGKHKLQKFEKFRLVNSSNRGVRVVNIKCKKGHFRKNGAQFLDTLYYHFCYEKSIIVKCIYDLFFHAALMYT